MLKSEIIVSENNYKMGSYIYRILKRFFDLTFSLFLLVFLLPIFIIISIAIKLNSRGPVIFVQKRIGKNRKIFTIYKFRTMYINAPANLPSYQIDLQLFVTPVGRLLRKTSLDELPQIFNIIKGDMSFIGPRPLIVSEYTIYIHRLENNIYSVLPGLTGWAQINGRDEISIEDKIKYDCEYIQNLGIKIDAIIFLKSIFKVILQENIMQEEYSQTTIFNKDFSNN